MRWTRLRTCRLLARLSELGRRRRRRGTDTVMVPLTLRVYTADGEDVRLLLELWLRCWDSPTGPSADRLAYSVVAPAVARRVGHCRLADLSADLGVLAVDEEVAETLAGLGAELLRVDVVAVEHLLLSPSATPAHAHGSW